MTEVQRSFDPSILERQVTAAADLQAFQVTGSNQPGTDFAQPEGGSVQRLPTLSYSGRTYADGAKQSFEICNSHRATFDR